LARRRTMSPDPHERSITVLPLTSEKKSIASSYSLSIPGKPACAKLLRHPRSYRKETTGVRNSSWRRGCQICVNTVRSRSKPQNEGRPIRPVSVRNSLHRAHALGKCTYLPGELRPDLGKCDREERVARSLRCEVVPFDLLGRGLWREVDEGWGRDDGRSAVRAGFLVKQDRRLALRAPVQVCQGRCHR